MQLNLDTYELKLYSNRPQVITESPKTETRIGELSYSSHIRQEVETPKSPNQALSSASVSIQKSHAETEPSVEEESTSKKARLESRYKTVELKLECEVKFDDNNKHKLVATVTNENQSDGIDLPEQLGNYQLKIRMYKQRRGNEEIIGSRFCCKGTNLIENLLLFGVKLTHLAKGQSHVYEIDLDDFYQLVNGVYKIRCKLDLLSDTKSQNIISNETNACFIVQLDSQTKNNVIFVKLSENILNCFTFA